MAKGWMLLTGAVAAAFGLAGPAAAQSSLQDRYWLEGSAYWPKVDSEVSVSRPGNPGTKIDLESDLNLENSKTLGSIQAGARIGKRWSVVGEAYAVDRSGERTLTRDLVFDAATYPAGIRAEAGLDSTVYRLSVGYAFLKTDKAELGAALGLHATDFKVFLRGDARVGGATFTGERRAKDFLAPLPTIGAYGTMEVMPRVSLTGRFDWLSLKVGDYDGKILNAQAGLGYRVTKNFEAGVAYRFVKYDLNVEKENYTAGVNYDFHGPAVYLRVGFQ